MRYRRIDFLRHGVALHEMLPEEQLEELRSTLPVNPEAKDCVGCGHCCKDCTCGGGYEVKDLDGTRTCDKLVEVNRIDGVPQYRCLVFEQMLRNEGAFGHLTLEPGKGCGYGVELLTYPVMENRLKLYQATKKS